MTLTDNIIDTYIAHPKTGPSCDTIEFRELSERFHTVARQTFSIARLHGWLQPTEPMQGFWKKWEDRQL